MSVTYGDQNINAEIGTPSLSADISRPSISINFNAPTLGAKGGGTLLRELVNPQFFIGTVTTLEPDQDVYCYLTGTKDAPVLNFGIPKGYKGDTGADGADGADGQAATIEVGTVSTGLPTDPASVTNTGTSTAAVFDFVIPKGDKGDTGATGATGAGVASGGTTGQVLKKKSSTNYDTEWGAVEAVPQGGTTGQVLAKKTNTDFDIEWIDPPDGTVTDVTVNGTSVVTSGVAAVTVPTPAPTDGATPSSDTQYGSVGTSTQYARKDHRHTSNFPTTGTPADLGTAANGTSATYAHSDHVHNYPAIVHVGNDAPTDSNIEVWLDTDDTSASVVTSVNGQSGAVMIPYINPPDFSQITRTALTSGTATKITSVGAWYCVRAINTTTSGSCFAYILDKNNDQYLSASVNPASDYQRATTAWLYFPKDAEFYARASFTYANYSGVLCAPPL
jgi:hypothetical protein